MDCDCESLALKERALVQLDNNCYCCTFACFLFVFVFFMSLLHVHDVYYKFQL